MNLRCTFGFHDWRSTEVGTIPEDRVTVGDVILRRMARTFWDNKCVRCGKTVSFTFRYENVRRIDPEP